MVSPNLPGFLLGFAAAALIALLVAFYRSRTGNPRNRESFFGLLAAEARDYAIVSMDRDRRITAWNAGAQRVLGYSEEEILGKSGDIFFTPEDRAQGAPEQEFAKAFATGQATDDRWHLRKDGSRFYASGILRPLPKRPGAGAYKIFRDITERKKTEAALRENAQRLRLLFENVREYALFQTDREGHITSWNPGAERLFGYRHEEIIGKDAAILLTPADRAARVFDQEFAKVEQTGHLEVARSLARKDGSQFWARWVTEAIRDEQGAMVGFVKVLRDETERKRAEDDLRNSRESLSQLSKGLEQEVAKRTEELRSKERQLNESQKLEAIGRLAGGVAHDFNNLMTGIFGITQEVKGSLTAEDPRQADLQEIIQAADRAFHVTRQLLTFARRDMAQPRRVDVNQVVRDVTRMLNRLLGEDIALEISLGEPQFVKMDSGHLEQILINLAINARDAMPNGGTLSLTTRRAQVGEETPKGQFVLKPGPYALIEVSDTGEGMDPEVMAHIFEPFFTTKEREKGTGLGLSTVYGILQQAGGDIRVESQRGKGTRFWIHLPITQDTDGGASEENPGSFEGSETILLVEDEDMVRNVVARKLKRKGYRVIEARHGSEAIDLSNEHPEHIDLILTDIVMPGLNGRQAVDLIRAHRPQVPALYMSGYPKDLIGRRGILDSGINFIDKSLIPMELVRRVRQVLDESKQSSGKPA
jgi:PAS domain S-box-containing protein